MWRSLFFGRPLSPRKDPCARWPRFPVLAKFRDFPMKFADFSSKISESCKKNAFLLKVCRPSPWKIKNNSYYWAIWRRTQVGKGRLCKSPIPQFESERCLEKGGWFHPSFRFKFPKKKVPLGAELFRLRKEMYQYLLPLLASIVTLTVFSPSTFTSFSAARPLLHSARIMWSPASRF